MLLRLPSQPPPTHQTPPPNTLRAALHHEAGALAPAIALYRSAIAVAPGFPEALNNLGNALRDAAGGPTPGAADAYVRSIAAQYAQAGRTPLPPAPLSPAVIAATGAPRPPCARRQPRSALRLIDFTHSNKQPPALRCAGVPMRGGRPPPLLPPLLPPGGGPAAALPPALAARLSCTYGNLGALYKLDGQLAAAIVCYEQASAGRCKGGL